jgi:dinuclear metal center YbgI/SA1388 family protein
MTVSITRVALAQYLNDLLQPQNFEDYAPNGVQIEGKTEVMKIAFAVSATKESIHSALEWGADALIVHHGVFWKYQGARTVTGAWGERLRQCIKHDLNLLAYHLPLDAHPEVGNAVALAREIGLTNLVPFALYKKQPLGIKGEFATPIMSVELQSLLSKLLAHQVIHAAPENKPMIKTLGIITGGANNEWVKAMEDKLDAFLTGEISEYNWHDSREAGVHYFAGGHHATERPGIKSLMERVKSELKVDVTFFDSQNPA